MSENKDALLAKAKQDLIEANELITRATELIREQSEAIKQLHEALKGADCLVKEKEQVIADLKEQRDQNLDRR